MREMLDLEDSSTAGETVLGHHPHNMAAHSPFTGRPQENGFDEMAPLQVSSGSVSKLYCDLIIKCCERDAVNSLGCCAAKFVNNSFTSTGMERFLPSGSKLEAARRLFWEPLDISREIIYAQSNWSLAVLRLMLETPTTIIPVSIIVVIYYGPVFRWVAEGKGRYMNAFVYRVLRKSRGVHQLFRNSLMNGYEVKNKDLRRLQ